MRAVPLLLALAVLAAVAAALMPGWSEAILWGLAQQRQLHRELTAHLHALVAGDGPAVWALVAASFLYGVLHAAGPGHGKVVIAAYLATHESHLRRGMVLAAGASFCQGLTAVLLVGGMTALAGWLPWETQSAATWSERASFVLLAAMGALLALKAMRRLAPIPAAGQAAPHHDHAAPHDHGDGCACCHVPSPCAFDHVDGLRDAVGVSLSIGLRPCSGALLVLALANMLDLAGAGIVAVAAMSAGTAMTVATLALVVVKARRWAQNWFQDRRAARFSRLGPAMALLGGMAVLLLALSLLAASFAPAHPIGF